ncbi:MAG: hypothetical protein B5M53_01715 [Candidatus Cloacimonas sp. 4484_209]|nr:MAG: hypothetical protein B5M53_01715 [Candidatus Cloacimonas sp. 4484_209]
MAGIHNISILIMEDDISLARLLKKTLKKDSYKIDTVSDGKQGLLALKQKSYDMLLIDQEMPYMKGLDVIRNISSGNSLPPIIMITGKGNENIAVEAMKLGVRDYIIKDKQGMFLKLLPSVIKTVIEQENARKQKRKMEELLHKSEEQYRSLVENLNIGIYRTSTESRSRFIQVNKAIVEIFGYNSPDELKKFPPEHFYYNPDDRKAFISKIKKTGYVKNEELLLKKKDGTPIWCAVTARAHYNKSGNIEWIDGALEDISKRKQLEEMQKRVQKLLLRSAKMEAIGRLAGGVAHEFNNLLTGIIGFSELLSLQAVDNPAIAQNIDKIKKLARKASRIANQLLIFSQGKQAKKTLLNLNNLIKNNKELISHIIGENITLQLLLQPRLHKTVADPELIEQILVNLTVNAAEAMPDGGTLTISTKNVSISENIDDSQHHTRSGNFILLSISDTGLGMSQEVIHRIFEPFFTTKEVGKGMGLGLSATYGIIKQHNGWLDVESEQGKGTNFKIYFPSYTPVTKRHTRKTNINKVSFPSSGKRILLVEDEELVRDIIARTLTDSGYKVFAASDAESAINIFLEQNGAFDLIFSDVVMPGKNGLEMAQELLSHKKELKILFSSGYIDDRSRRKLIEEKGFNFLAKPYSIDDMLKTVKNILTF